MDTIPNGNVPTQLKFELVSVLLLTYAALVEASFTYQVWFTAVYTFACVTASVSWLRSRDILTPKVSTHLHLGPLLTKSFIHGLPVILILVSVSHMLHRASH